MLRAVISFCLFILFLSFQATKNDGNQFNDIEQFLICIVSRFNPLQFRKDGGKLLFQILIHPRIALHDHILIQTAAVTVFLLRQSR